MNREFCAFDGTQKIAEGNLLGVAEDIKRYCAKSGQQTSVAIFDKQTSQITDVLLQGSESDTEQWIRTHVPDALPPVKTGRGRPKLGVVSREITLLPRQWDWLNKQQGGASVTLRKLVDAARKDPAVMKREAQDSIYRFATLMAGDEVGFEEVMRALYANDRSAFLALISAWPTDVCAHVTALAEDAF